MRPEQGPLWGCDAEEAGTPTPGCVMTPQSFGGVAA
jgi:hypothetical protein